jgi:hypothetical protein
MGKLVEMVSDVSDVSDVNDDDDEVRCNDECVVLSEG